MGTIITKEELLQEIFGEKVFCYINGKEFNARIVMPLVMIGNDDELLCDNSELNINWNDITEILRNESGMFSLKTRSGEIKLQIGIEL